jgi:S-adenosylmethionine:tRNA ribosyltransferase-isomerase
MEKMGELPLPPYIKSDSEKQKRYQPTISEKPGSVAAPTASLHFTKELLEEIKKRQIQTESLILHV